MEYGSLYFYTSTIHQWKPSIQQYNFYNIILESLAFLHNKGLIRVYGFVIMPNHIHLIWQILKPNGKESPVASFKKFTAHRFEQHILKISPEDLINYQVDWHSRKYNFWQPEPHWFLLFNEKTLIQKLNYIHKNPVSKKWSLANDYIDYPFSSARFYETGVNDFSFLYHYADFNDKVV
ncbi:MAG: hypothetical protein RLZZ28_1784 [Bacteroidota bacterium]|jgi:REP element-mobilizing transposase RayT